jgi:YD repeat-containing protein
LLLTQPGQSARLAGPPSRFVYDPFGQLLFEDNTIKDDHTYPYDATGNRVAAGQPADAGNLVAEDATYQYQYDNEGNLEKKTTKATGAYTIRVGLPQPAHEGRNTQLQQRSPAGRRVRL